ncbi:preprotein translocase subunit SecE [Blattabacterium cuenoti]|uniref:preprotein translocase subunit SecE n=1 Tax=Blattabacterium cuenoti TaxID=1653831 RepID=UPI00163C335A|nr:preprotein translocase subunit SecE [Blattabacterium cuenoti]
MKKTYYLIEVCNELFYNITWTNWNNLKQTTLLVFFVSILLSICLYGVDQIFIFFIKKFFLLKIKNN